ncbi:MAG TPA: GNAT family N-acetyltransferase [Bryobacteraceae bacterium]|nr:GNAT family N-acetyltransferase [Bryobacteraceae bacterium]
MTVSVRPLTPVDVPALLRIKAAAGWNQTETDWLNLLRLSPDLCFGLECDGVLAATTTAVCYQRRLAWIGMVLTDPGYRRRGFARRLLEHAIEALAARGIEWIKLDATEMGAPLYRQLGFEPESAIERWEAAAGHTLRAPDLHWQHPLSALDRQAFGADRSELAAVLAPLGAAALADEGYAMARPGSRTAYFGPCVSRGAGTAAELLAWFLSRHAGEPVCWDLLPRNNEAARLARANGFAPVRRLVRMVRRGRAGAAPLIHDDSLVFACAGFEYG